MEIKLNVYADKFCRKLDQECIANDFSLSTAICEEVLSVVNIDAFEGGLQAMSKESQVSYFMDLVKNGLPYFTDLLKDLFELKEGYFKVADVVTCVKDIVFYSMSELGKAFPKKEKN